MSSGMGIVEWLRPLVETNAWDYAVVWKYGDDPTRFIEWLGCCCGGGSCEKLKLKEELDEQYNLVPICRDTLFQHPVTTNTCHALSKLPLTMSLYSGVHGEVALSQQPRWLTQEDSTATQVLIPIFGGLVELFTEKLVPEDKNIMEFITAHCYPSLSFNEHYPSTDGIQLYVANQSSSNPSIEGPSNGTNPSSEHLSFDSKSECLIPHDQYLKQSANVSRIPIAKRTKYSRTLAKCQIGSSSDDGNGEEDKGKIVRNPKIEDYHAKNLVTERNRRNRIKKGLFTLRSLVPNITKMDRASIVADAMDYIKELQKQEKELQEEVRALEVEDFERNTLQLGMPTAKEQKGTRSLPLIELNQSSSACTKKTIVKVHVEVNHIGRKDFLIQICCEQKQSGFSRLMEALHSFGLHVASANMTTFDGKVLNILTVEASEEDIHPEKLKDYLIQQIG